MACFFSTSLEVQLIKTAAAQNTWKLCNSYMSKCKFKNLILSRQIWSFCSWLPRKPVNYYAFASALCVQLLKHFIIIFLLFCLKLVFVERAGLTALANEIVCLPTDYVLPRQWQSKLPHAVLSACHNFFLRWGEDLKEEVFVTSGLCPQNA